MIRHPYSYRDATHILPLLDEPFSLVPMRATGITDYRLEEGRRSLLEYVADRAVSRQRNDPSRNRLFVSIAVTSEKGPLEPYEERARAVACALDDIGSRARAGILGHIPSVYDRVDLWPHLCLVLYEITPNSNLDMYVIPSAGVEEGGGILR